MNEMQSISMRSGKVVKHTTFLPEPGAGQVLVKSLACGICGSDLHITKHSDEVFDIYKNLGVMPQDAGSPDIDLGHEFCAEVVKYGPQTNERLSIGTRVTCIPFLLSQDMAGVGVTPGVYGAYSEYFILDEALLIEVPDNVPSLAAAITEPLAVGLHTINRSGITQNDVALVAGCGAIGLAAITALKQMGVNDIIASDPVASKRDVATEFGASVVVDPTNEDEVAIATNIASEKGRLFIFECVGIHQLINNFILRAPQHSTLVVTGIHTATSEVNFGYATVKEMDIKFSYYYSPEEFAQALGFIAQGKVKWELMCTGTVGIDGISGAIEQLLKPNEHIKVIVEPWRNGELEAKAVSTTQEVSS